MSCRDRRANPAFGVQQECNPLLGDGDQPDILAIADWLHMGVPGAPQGVMPGVAHLPNIAQPGRFNRLVRDFPQP